MTLKIIFSVAIPISSNPCPPTNLIPMTNDGALDYHWFS